MITKQNILLVFWKEQSRNFVGKVVCVNYVITHPESYRPHSILGSVLASSEPSLKSLSQLSHNELGPKTHAQMKCASVSLDFLASLYTSESNRKAEQNEGGHLHLLISHLLPQRKFSPKHFLKLCLNSERVLWSNHNISCFLSSWKRFTNPTVGKTLRDEPYASTLSDPVSKILSSRKFTGNNILFSLYGLKKIGKSRLFYLDL